METRLLINCGYRRGFNCGTCKGALVSGVSLLMFLLAPDRLSGGITTIDLSPLVPKSTLVGPLDKEQQISVVLVLPLSDARGAASFVQQVSWPGNPLYHRYITPQEFADRFGGSAADYTALKDWATANGLEVTQESIARTSLTVRGSVAQLQTIFKTQINRYLDLNGEEFYSANIKPTVPSAISAKISGLIGLTGSRQYSPLVKLGKRLGESPAKITGQAVRTDGSPGGTGPGGAYSAADLRTAYSIPGFGSLDDKTVVAVFEQGGFDLSDVTEYLTKNGLPEPKITVVSVDHSPTTVTNANVEIEGVLDIDMIVAINPSVHEVLAYEDSVDSLPVALVDAMTQVANDNKAQILSISYGQDEYLQGKNTLHAEHSVLTQLAAQGITVVASSGNNGAYGDQSDGVYNVYDPASQPYVTGVGGTTLFTGKGQQYEFEQVYNELQYDEGASGGGISSYWPFPSYDSSAGTGYFTTNGGSSTYRNVPDVAVVGDPFTGVAIYSKVNGGWLEIGGTGVSAAIWAGYLSVVNAVFKFADLGTIGSFNPLLYAVGEPDYQPSSYLYDIETGTNGNTRLYSLPGYSAGVGYSNCTGVGSIWGGGFVPALMAVGKTFGTNIGLVNTINVIPGTNSAQINWNKCSGASVYFVELTHAGTIYYITTTYATKQTSMELTGLVPDDNYSVAVWAVNATGFSNNQVTFATK
ncbi:MAG: protease pro-enzyme activation domain-containing protein [Chthoniobacterales bacterium]